MKNSDENIKSGEVLNDLELINKFHNKAAQAANEKRKLLISLSTGTLAVFYFALTNDITPSLTPTQMRLLLITVLLTGVAIFSGIYSWKANAQMNYTKAKFKELLDRHKKNLPVEERINDYLEENKEWEKKYKIADGILTWGFLLGQFAAILYLISRITV